MSDDEDQVFRLLPGEKVLQIVGMPGPDTDECEVVDDAGGDTVLIRFQVYGRGNVYEERVKRSCLAWLHGSETSRRFNEWRALQQKGPSNGAE